ncbi:MAG: SHIRT domain-containing protein [Oscillospiraceae bacterium]
MKKRFLSIVLAVLMLLSVLPVTAMAADRTTVNTAQNGIEATKTAKWVNEKEGIAEITITVKGEPPEVSTPEVDAVLVIDLSGSMNDNNKLNDAKAAAKKFVDKFFGTSAPASYKKSVRIAVVGYNGYAKACADLTEAKNADALYTLFGSGYGSLSAGGGTNIQDGIYRAQQILKNGRAGAKKVMVVLSDGEPTYSFDANVAHTFGQNEETYGVKKNNFLYVVSEIDHTDRVGSGSAYATGDYHYYYYCKDDKNVQQYYYVQNHGVGTVSEAYWAKKDGTTIYSIGFGISQYESGGYGLPQRETDVYKVAQSLASDDKKFKLAKDGGELGNVFDGIANEVAKYTAYNPTVIDTMGKNFEVVSNSLPTDKKVTLKSDGSLEWDITDGELDTTEHKLTFQVKYDKTKLTDDEMLLTNGEAKLIYSKTEGGEQNQEQPITSGQVENLAFTVTYLDETGAKLTSAPYTETRYWYGDTVAIEKGPVKTGYDFTVWTVTGVTPAEGATSFDMPKNNVTLKANYTEKDYLLSTGVYYISDNVVPPDSVLYSYSSVGSPRLKKDAQVTLPDFVDVQDSEHDGVWKFRGWYEYYGLSTARKYEGTFTMPARDVSLDAVWTFQKNERVNVNYEYAVDDDCDGKYTLPTELTPPAAESIIKGRTATPKTLSEAEKTYSTTEGTWSFTGWTPEKHENVTEDVTFTGKWHFTPYERVNVDYEYAVDDDCDGKYTLPTELTPPAAESIIKGRTATPKTLSEAEKTYSTTEGTWSFTGWTPEKHENVTEDVTFTGKWHFTPYERVNVDYEYAVDDDCDGKYTLPTELTPPAAESIIKGRTATPKTLSEAEKTYSTTEGTWSFTGWTPEKHENVTEDVTFTGKWHFTPYERVNVDYEYAVDDDCDGKYTLPTELTPPAAESIIKGRTATPKTLSEAEKTYSTTEGTWSFTGWTPEKHENVTENVTFTGKWHFTENEPKETTYSIKYYRQDADGKYSNKPYYTRTMTDAGVPLKGNVGDTVKIEDLEPFYKEHYKGYEFDEDAENVRSLQLKADANENVLKLYYKAEALMTLDKDYVAYRDGEELDLSDGEELKAGDVIQYTITLKNTGTRNLTNVTVEDTFTGAEGELVFISGDAYEIDEDTGIISLKDTLKPGETVDIRADYEVQLNDSGWRITNEVLGDATELPPAGKPHASVTITPEALKNYEIHVSADKYVKSVKGTFNKDEEDVDFTFAVSSDKRGKNELDRFDITVDESVKAGETSSRFDGGITIRLTEEEFDDLKWETFEGDGKKYPVVYLREVKGSDKKMRYDTSVVTLYLLVPQVIVTSHDPIYKTTSLNAWVDPTDSTLWPEFTNVYGKESSSSDTVKVGPQLNRDDHVAYIMGYPDGTVQPKGEITRAEACTIFFRLLTDSSRDYYFSKTNDYTDVNAGDWFNNAISTLSNAGIVTGYNDGTFRPNQPITRGEMAKIIANFANLNKGTKSFTDLSGHWSKSYVELAAGNGWIAGYPDGSFRPDQKITRAETVTMINRVLERVPAKELRLLSRSIMLTFPDNNPGDWYYIAIQEASNSHEYQRSVYETTGDEMWTKLIDNVDWTKLEK